jgi:hypothetical protein
MQHIVITGRFAEAMLTLTIQPSLWISMPKTAHVGTSRTLFRGSGVLTSWSTMRAGIPPSPLWRPLLIFGTRSLR